MPHCSRAIDSPNETIKMTKRYATNKYGVIQFPKGDVRRLLVLVAAIDRLERPTITTLAKYTGHNKGVIQKDVAKVSEQLGIIVEKHDATYSVSDWGEIVKKRAVKKFFQL